MNWDDGRLFLAVARAGQLLGAARQVGLNQATLSRRMNALEDDLGVRLLIRRTTGCDLTDEGRRLLELIEAAEASFLSASTMRADGDAVVGGTVRIGAPDGFGSLFLAPRLGAVRARFPNLSIELVPVPRSFSLSQREADVAIMIERPTQGRLFARKLTDYTLGIYGSGTYLSRRGRPATVADLSGHDLIGYVEDLLYAPALDFTREVYSGWKSAIQVSTAVGQLQAVRGGAGLGTVHDFLAAGLPDLQLVLPEVSITRSYWTVVHESQRGLARIAGVVDAIHDLVRAERSTFIRTARGGA